MARKKMKRFAEGGSDNSQARYDRKLADIESDYTKWQKSGKYGSPGVAKAKYEQRLADAKDDLAKWTGGDRSQTSAAEKASENALSEARRTNGRSIEVRDSLGGDKPLEMKPVDLSAIKTPNLLATKARSASKPRASTVTAPKAAPKPVTAKKPEVPKAAAPKATVQKPVATKKSAASPDSFEERQKRKYGASSFSIKNLFKGSGDSDYAKRQQAKYGGGDASKLRAEREKANAKAAADARKAKEAKSAKDSSKPKVDATTAYFRKKNANPWARDNMKTGGKVVKKYAKGGSVDGCAIRGKTRAPMKRK